MGWHVDYCIYIKISQVGIAIVQNYKECLATSRSYSIGFHILFYVQNKYKTSEGIAVKDTCAKRYTSSKTSWALLKHDIPSNRHCVGFEKNTKILWARYTPF